jgi:cold shock CspA family protein
MMSILDKFRKPDEPTTTDIEPKVKETVERKRVEGKIIKLSDDGWGFITTKEIPFTRIFFHWTSLNQDTLHFTELKVGMEVEFTPIELNEKGWRAIRIDVLEDDPSETLKDA